MQRHRQKWAAKSPKLAAVEEKEGETTPPREAGVGPFFRRRMPKPGYVHPATPMPLARNYHIERLAKVPKDPNPRVGSMSNLAPATRTRTLPGTRAPAYFPRFNVTKPAASQVLCKPDTSDAPKGKKCLQKASPQREWQEILARNPPQTAQTSVLNAPVFNAPFAPASQGPVLVASPVEGPVPQTPFPIDPAIVDPALIHPVNIAPAPVGRVSAPVYHAKFDDPFPYGRLPGLCDSITRPPPMPPGPFGEAARSPQPFPKFKLISPVCISLENSICLPRDGDGDIVMHDASPPRLAAPQDSSFPSVDAPMVDVPMVDAPMVDVPMVDVPIVEHQQPANIWAQGPAQDTSSRVAALPESSLSFKTPAQNNSSLVTDLPLNPLSTTSLPKAPQFRKRGIDQVDEPQLGPNWEMTETTAVAEQAPLAELADPFGLNRTPAPHISGLRHYYDRLENPEARGPEQQAVPVDVVVAPPPATPVAAEGHLPEEEHAIVGAVKWTWNNVALPITKYVAIPMTKYVLVPGGKLAWRLSRKTGVIAYRHTCRLAGSAKRRVVEVYRTYRQRNAREVRRSGLPERALERVTTPTIPRSERRRAAREEEFRRSRAEAARVREERFLQETMRAAANSPANRAKVDQEMVDSGVAPRPAKAGRRSPLRPADGNVAKKRRAPPQKPGKQGTPAPRRTATPSKRPPPSGALRVITPGRGDYRITDGDKRRNADVLAQWAATSGEFARREVPGVGSPATAPAERCLRPSIPGTDSPRPEENRVSSLPRPPSRISAPVTSQPEENRASPSPAVAQGKRAPPVAIPEVYDEFGGYSSVPVANPHRNVENWLDLEEALLEAAATAPPANRVESPALVSPELESEEEESEVEEEEEEVKEPRAPFIKPLSAEWETRIDNVSAKPPSQTVAVTLRGDPLTKRDVESCYSPQAWLNDEVINAYLEHIVDNARRAANNNGRNAKPKFHAFNSFFYSNLRDKGYESVRRWATRAKIGGSSLLNVDTVFIPVHHGMHWTLLVVKPSARTIEYFDSLDGSPTSHINRVKTWLSSELGKDYIESEWKTLPGHSPQQNNGFDCGVFLLMTAKLCSLDLPLNYTACDIPMIRRKIVAELMNGGFDGDFSPSIEFAGWGEF